MALPTRKKLPQTKNHGIRLLRLFPGAAEETLRCEMLSSFLNTAPGYEVLSCTNNSEEEVDTILMDGSPTSVPQNLVQALRSLRKDITRPPTIEREKDLGRRVKWAQPLEVVASGKKKEPGSMRWRPKMLWFEGLCSVNADAGNGVGQRERTEVKRDVYVRATKVIAWLGEGKDDVDMELAVRACEFVYTRFGPDVKGLEKEVGGFWKALQWVYESGWWEMGRLTELEGKTGVVCRIGKWEVDGKKIKKFAEWYAGLEERDGDEEFREVVRSWREGEGWKTIGR